MTAITTTSIIRNARPNTSWANQEMLGQRDRNLIELRDKSIAILEDDRYVSFFAPGAPTGVPIARHLDADMDTFWTNYGANFIQMVKDINDNLLIMSMYNYGYHAGIMGWKINKPAEGWLAWLNNPSRGALTSARFFDGQSRPDHRWNYAASSTEQGWDGMTGWHVARAANVSGGVLFLSIGTSGNGRNDRNNYTDQVGFTWRLDNGNLISHGGYDSYNGGSYYPYRPYSSGGYFEGNTGWNSNISWTQPFQPFASSGLTTAWYCRQNYGLSYYQSDSYSNKLDRFSLAFRPWYIDANGTLTSQNGYNNLSPYYFGADKTCSYESGNSTVSLFAHSSTYGPLGYTDPWYGLNKSMTICSKLNGKPVLNLLLTWFDTSDNNWKPKNWTYSTLPTNWVNYNYAAPTIGWISDTVLRMVSSDGTNGAYMDITWNGTDFIFPSTATPLTGMNGVSPHMPAVALLDNNYIFNRNTTGSQALASGFSTSYNYSSFGSFPEPYVPTLKANNGIKFQYQSSVTANSANTNWFGTDMNYNSGVWTTFQFKRVSSGNGTEYYNYTTNAWTSSVVNNAASLFPGGGGACPPYSSTGYYVNDIQGSWADNTTYTYSYVFTDMNGVSKETGIKTLSTPAVSAAPTAPTPRRLFVYTLQNRSSSHVLSVENRVLINKVNLVNKSANSVGVSLNLGGFEFLANVTLAPYQTAQFETAVIANPAERLLVTANADASVDMWIMGTEGV